MTKKNFIIENSSNQTYLGNTIDNNFTFGDKEFSSLQNTI